MGGRAALVDRSSTFDSRDAGLGYGGFLLGTTATMPHRRTGARALAAARRVDEAARGEIASRCSSRTVDGAYLCKTASRAPRGRGGSWRATSRGHLARVAPRPARPKFTPRPSRVVSSPSIPFRPGAARSRLETYARDGAKVSTALGWIPRVVEWRARGARAPTIPGSRDRVGGGFGKSERATAPPTTRAWAISLKRVIAK